MKKLLIILFILVIGCTTKQDVDWSEKTKVVKAISTFKYKSGDEVCIKPGCVKAVIVNRSKKDDHNRYYISYLDPNGFRKQMYVRESVLKPLKKELLASLFELGPRLAKSINAL